MLDADLFALPELLARCQGDQIPEMVLISVDLPAPLSPTSASTSPG